MRNQEHYSKWRAYVEAASAPYGLEWECLLEYEEFCKHMELTSVGITEEDYQIQAIDALYEWDI